MPAFYVPPLDGCSFNPGDYICQYLPVLIWCYHHGITPCRIVCSGGKGYGTVYWMEKTTCESRTESDVRALLVRRTRVSIMRVRFVVSVPISSFRPRAIHRRPRRPRLFFCPPAISFLWLLLLSARLWFMFESHLNNDVHTRLLCVVKRDFRTRFMRITPVGRRSPSAINKTSVIPFGKSSGFA